MDEKNIAVGDKLIYLIVCLENTGGRSKQQTLAKDICR